MKKNIGTVLLTLSLTLALLGAGACGDDMLSPAGTPCPCDAPPPRTVVGFGDAGATDAGVASDAGSTDAGTDAGSK